MKRRIAVGLAAVLVCACLAVLAVRQWWPTACVDEVVAGDEIAAPFRAQPEDDRVQRLADSADAWDFGTTFASRGYDYDRFVDFAPLNGHFAVWLGDEPVMEVVDASNAEPVWGIRQAAVRHTWDASAERFVMLAAPKDDPIEVSAHALDTGARRWCVRLAQPPVGATDPISTNVDTAGNVLVLAGAPDDLRLTSLAAGDGAVRWTESLEGVDRGDYVSSAWQGVVVVGGRPAHELGEPAGKQAGVLAGVAEDSGKVRWRHEVAAATTASVVGDSDGQLVVRESGPGGQELVMLDQETGAEQWRQSGLGGVADMVVRGGVVLIRTNNVLYALDIGTGEPSWRMSLRQQPQLFPYGFRLAEQPMLDPDHLLLGLTDSLLKVDLGTGATESWALPTDGINTTWWPYRVALSGSTLAVATNTGAVLVGRR